MTYRVKCLFLSAALVLTAGVTGCGDDAKPPVTKPVEGSKGKDAGAGGLKELPRQ